MIRRREMLKGEMNGQHIKTDEMRDTTVNAEWNESGETGQINFKCIYLNFSK